MTAPVEQAHDFEIIRHKGNKVGEPPSFATYGRVFDAHGIEIIVCLEKPWVDGNGDGKRDSMLSRAAPGLYRAFLRKSYLNGGTGKRKVDVIECKSDDHNAATTDDVPDMVAMQVHIANLPHEIDGCVATGTAFGKAIDKRDGKEYDGVTGSTPAFEKWMREALACMARNKRDYLWIRVTDAFPASVPEKLIPNQT